jgi:protein phosphatase
VELLRELGYVVNEDGEGPNRRISTARTHARRVVFVGDLVDRGPHSPEVLRIVLSMIDSGIALAVPGNHDVRFLRWLDGKTVRPTHGLDLTIAQFEKETPEFRERVRTFIATSPSYLWLDGGRLAVAHAGIKEDMLGRGSADVRGFCLYGETSGEMDEFGLPIRYHWAAEYGGATSVVYGHTPVPEPDWVNNTLCIDTGCCFGGKLSALRWPEKKVVSVPAARVYTASMRPFGHPPVRPGAAAQ